MLLLLLIAGCSQDVQMVDTSVSEPFFPEPSTLEFARELSLGGRPVTALLSEEAEVGVRVLDALLVQESETMKLLGVGVSPDHYALLALSEHTGGSGSLSELDASLTRMGRDLLSMGDVEHASGARGLFQIMPVTYRRLAERYPSAGLVDDLINGRSDPANALRAAVAHTHSEASVFVAKRRNTLSQDESLWRLLLTAGYNANIQTIVNALDACGDSWRSVTCESPIPDETRRHLMRYEGIEYVLYE